MENLIAFGFFFFFFGIKLAKGMSSKHVGLGSVAIFIPVNCGNREILGVAVQAGEPGRAQHDRRRAVLPRCRFPAGLPITCER